MKSKYILWLHGIGFLTFKENNILFQYTPLPLGMPALYPFIIDQIIY